MANPAAGWYPDPAGDQTKLRWWDGNQWTENYTNYTPQPAQNASVVPAQPAQQPAVQAQPAQQPAYATTTATAADSNSKTLFLVAFIFCIISTVATCWLLIPLAWMIPMSVHCWGIYKGTKKNTTAFGVCTLIFVNLVAGILLLVAPKDE